MTKRRLRMELELEVDIDEDHVKSAGCPSVDKALHEVIVPFLLKDLVHNNDETVNVTVVKHDIHEILLTQPTLTSI